MANKSGKKTYFYLGIILLFIIILHYLGWIRSPESLLRSITVPALGRVHSFSVKAGNDYQFFKNREDFLKAYEASQAAMASLAASRAKLQLAESENDELKKQLNYQKKQPMPSILAEVIGKEILSTDQTIIINRGSDDGIKLNQPIIVGEGVLIGKISQLNRDTSIVRLIDDNQSRVGATILNRSKSIGVVEGGYGVGLKMILIPRNEVVLIGDQVVSSGLEKGVPRGLLLGTVAVVENEAYQLFQEAVLTPSVELNKLTIVSVLLTN